MQFPHLFSPLQIGRVTVANRISFSAHLTNLADDGLPTERLIDYLAARARGGTGLIITEEQSVHPTDRAYEHLIEAFLPEVIPGYKQLTRAVHEYDTRIFAQLNHNGQQCSGSLSRLPVWAPSPIPDVLYRETPKAMEIEDIQEVIELLRAARPCTCARAASTAWSCSSATAPWRGSSCRRSPTSGATSTAASFENRMRFAAGGGGGGARRRWAPTSPWACGSAPTSSSPAASPWTTPSGSPQRLQATGHLDFFNLTLATFYNLYLVGGPMHLPLGLHGAAGGGHQVGRRRCRCSPPGASTTRPWPSGCWPKARPT